VENSDYVTVTRTNWGSSSCGLHGTLPERILDCATVFGLEATWDGKIKGRFNESVWKLVTRTGDVVRESDCPECEVIVRGREVWQDQNTGLLWSSLITKKQIDYCKASGTNDISGCEDNNVGNRAVSACAEDGENHLTSVHERIDPNGKGDLGFDSFPKVTWRLPSLTDYNQADIDGLRFIFPDMSSKSGTYFNMTSTVEGETQSYLWLFSNGGETLQSIRTTNWASVRCVGL
jgi:hypothetical protein